MEADSFMGMISYTLSLIIATLISIAVAVFSWKRRTSVAAKPLSLMMACVAVWLLGQTMQDISYSISIKLFWYYAKFLGIIFLPQAWLVFSLQYAKHHKFVTFKFMLLTSIIPFLSLLSVITNNFFFTFQSNIILTPGSAIQTVIPDNEFWFWIHTYYSYFLILIGILVLLDGFFRLPSIYRKQAGIILTSALLPTLFNIATVFRLVKFPYSDITPFALLVTGLLYFWALFRYKLLDLVPVARHALIESMSDMIFVLDNQNRLADINPAAIKYLGGTASQVIGKMASDIFSVWSDMVSRFKDINYLNEKIILMNHGVEQSFNLNTTPILNQKKEITGRLYVLRDITLLENAMKELKDSKKAAEAANEAKSHFLANMSHEIRTPMNAIMGMSELMGTTKLDLEQREYLLLIENSASSLLTIINDILDFSKIEAGKLEIEKIVFNIRELVDITTGSFFLQAKNKNLELKYAIGEDIPDFLVGDPLRTKQLLINLINNAIKFTPEKGHIGINIQKVENAELDDSQIRIMFSVSDTGLGIPEAEIEKLFESFHQLDSSTTRKYGGTGLGLSIVKSLAEIMGGCVKVESQVNVGSTFSFIIPFTIPSQVELSGSQSAATHEPVHESGKKAEEISILLAEDNKVNQMLMTKMVGKIGWHMDIADNGKIVLEMLAEHGYDLVLMDIQMPVMDGFEAASAIREKEKYSGKHIPIIALTANAMKGDKEKCLEAGMDDYLSKPVRSENLRVMVKKYL